MAMLPPYGPHLCHFTSSENMMKIHEKGYILPHQCTSRKYDSVLCDVDLPVVWFTNEIKQKNKPPPATTVYPLNSRENSSIGIWAPMHMIIPPKPRYMVQIIHLSTNWSKSYCHENWLIIPEDHPRNDDLWDAIHYHNAYLHPDDYDSEVYMVGLAPEGSGADAEIQTSINLYGSVIRYEAFKITGNKKNSSTGKVEREMKPLNLLFNVHTLCLENKKQSEIEPPYKIKTIRSVAIPPDQNEGVILRSAFEENYFRAKRINVRPDERNP